MRAAVLLNFFAFCRNSEHFLFFCCNSEHFLTYHQIALYLYQVESSYGLYSCGLYSYGLYSRGLYIVMAYI